MILSFIRILLNGQMIITVSEKLCQPFSCTYINIVLKYDILTFQGWFPILLRSFLSEEVEPNNIARTGVLHGLEQGQETAKDLAIFTILHNRARVRDVRPTKLITQECFLSVIINHLAHVSTNNVVETMLQRQHDASIIIQRRFVVWDMKWGFKCSGAKAQSERVLATAGGYTIQKIANCRRFWFWDRDSISKDWYHR